MKSLIVLVIFFGSFAQADIDNPYSLPVGDREALMANAGVALSGSAGNMFYNPAGLSELTGSRFTAGGSSYALVKARFTTGTNEELGYESFITVPNMAASTRRWGNWTVGLGVFIPITIQGGLEITQNIPAVSANARTSSRFEHSEQYLGVAAGRKLGGAWSGGASMFVHRSVNKNISSSIMTPYGAGTTYYSGYFESKEEYIGLLGLVGVQRKLSDKWLAGFRVATPELKLRGKSKWENGFVSVSAGTPTSSITSNEGGLNYKVPFDLNSGLTYENDRWLITFNLGLQMPTKFVDDPESTDWESYDTKATFRQNLGYEFRFNQTYSLIGGFARNPDTTGGTEDSSGDKDAENHSYSTTLGLHTKSKNFTSGIGVFYLVNKSKEELFAVAEDKENGVQIIGVLLSTSIEF